MLYSCHKWDESDSINQPLFAERFTFFSVIPHNEWLVVFGGFLSFEHDRANLLPTSTNSDATYPGLELIPPLAACRPRGSAPPRNSEYCVSMYVSLKMTPHVWMSQFLCREWALERRWKADVTTQASRDESWPSHSLGPQSQCESHDRELCYCTGKRDDVWSPQPCVLRSPITQIWQVRQIRSYPKNVNLPPFSVKEISSWIDGSS